MEKVHPQTEKHHIRDISREKLPTRNVQVNIISMPEELMTALGKMYSNYQTQRE